MKQSIQNIWHTILDHIGTTAAGSCIVGLDDNGVTEIFRSQGEIRFSDLAEQTHLMPGYLVVCLNVLADKGFCTIEPIGGGDFISRIEARLLNVLNTPEWCHRFTRALDAALIVQEGQVPCPLETGSDPEDDPFREMTPLSPIYASIMTELSLNNHSTLLIKNPGTAIPFKYLGLSHEYAVFIFNELARLGWCRVATDTVALTRAGTWALKLASQYYHTAGYLKLYHQIPCLLRQGKAWAFKTDGHLRRDIDIASSTKVFESTVKESLLDMALPVFNQPLQDQPDCIVDMGCGEGTLLATLYDFIRKQTMRGKQLSERPITIVGVDPSPIARKESRSRFEALGISYIVMDGDIADPGKLSVDLARHGLDPWKVLHISKSIFHNRRLSIISAKQLSAWKSQTRDSFSWRNGEMVPARLVEYDLWQVLNRWRPFIRKYGIIIIEAHTVSPLNVIYPEYTNILACLDATHGFSEQYLMGADVFQNVLQAAGFVAERLEYIGKSVFGQPVMSIGRYVTG